jgi:hypothetical protein
MVLKMLVHKEEQPLFQKFIFKKARKGQQTQQAKGSFSGKVSIKGYVLFFLYNYFKSIFLISEILIKDS